MNIDENILDVVKPTLEKKLKENGNPVFAIKIGTKIITGKQSNLTMKTDCMSLVMPLTGARTGSGY